MMPISRQLPLASAGLIVLAVWMLALSGNGWVQAVVATLLAATSVVVNDFRRTFVLSHFYANLAAVTIFLFVIARIPAFTGDEVLLAMTDALVFLQLVLMFKEKRAHDYALLLLANVLEVAVASALGLNYLLSLYLLIYSALAIYTLGVLLLQTECERYGTQRLELRGTPLPGRRPLSEQQPRFARIVAESNVESTIGREFRRCMTRVGLWTLLLTVSLFIAMPRIGQSSALQKFSPTQMVGFAEQISLHDLGQIHENTDRVMRVRLTSYATGAPILLNEAPWWFGGVLVEYNDGEWSRSERSPASPHLPLESVARGYPTLVRQQLSLEPSNSAVVGALFPPIRADYSSTMSYHGGREQLLRVRPAHKFECELFTLAIQDRQQLPIVPHRNAMSADERAELLQLPELTAGADRLTPLRELAAQIVAEVPENDRIGRARALEAYLSDATRFTYTLNLPIRDPQLDPMVDFLTVNRRGHCEYFASALALMLRAVGIPSRVVVGFKGGEVDAITSAYEVKQTDAHSWVEAYLEPTHVGAELLESPLWTSVIAPETDRSDVEGAWLRLDPTPFSATLDPSQQNVVWRTLREALSYARAAWANYVIGLDAQRQRELIYEPLQHAFQMAARWETWTDLKTTLIGELRATGRDLVAGNPLAWFRALFMLSVLGLVGVFVRKLVLRVNCYWTRALDGDSTRGARKLPIYVELERILARAGHRRQRHQTPREFAFHVGGELSDMPHTVAVAGVPTKISDAFYRVRYGGETLELDEVRLLYEALAQLRLALCQRRVDRRRM